MDAETTFYQSEDVAVTNARFIVGAQTFAMRGITSVKAIQIPAKYSGSIVLIFLGAIMALVCFAAQFGKFDNTDDRIPLFAFCGLGILLLALGIWLAKRQKPIFAVVLRTSGGEVTAYHNYDWNCISQIIEALNQSIISNG